MGRFVSKIVCRGKNKDGFWINEFFGTLALNIIFIMRLDSYNSAPSQFIKLMHI